MPISASLRQDLGDVPLLEDAGSLRMRSRDFFWFSPILKEKLEDKRAEIVAVPRNKSELIRIASACAKHRVPLTVRGGGTGNYGQAVPLEGGVVVDMTRIDQVIWHKPGAGRFGAGARRLDVDRALAPAGHELRFYPSTRQHATIGGFVAGGAAGAGSCTWGQIADPGAVLGVEVLTVEEDPRKLELRDRDVLKVMHAYGVNGIISEVEVPLAPSHPWCERIACFPSLAAAARFAQAFTECDGIAKKLVTVHDPQGGPYLRRVCSFRQAKGGHGDRHGFRAAGGRTRAARRRSCRDGDFPPQRRGCAQGCLHRNTGLAAALRVYLESHHAARHPDRSLDHLPATSLSPRQKPGAGRLGGAAVSRRGSPASRIPTPLRQGNVLEPAARALHHARAARRGGCRAPQPRGGPLAPAHFHPGQRGLEAR